MFRQFNFEVSYFLVTFIVESIWSLKLLFHKSKSICLDRLHSNKISPQLMAQKIHDTRYCLMILIVVSQVRQCNTEGAKPIKIKKS